MTNKTTAIDDVIVSVVATLTSALTYSVFDGPPSKLPIRGTDRYLVVGADDINDQTNPTNTAHMNQVWYGLGAVAREETLFIECMAVGKAKTIALARSVAMAVVQDVGVNLPQHPTAETYGAMVDSVSSLRSHNVSGGAIVQVTFTIQASARLT